MMSPPATAQAPVAERPIALPPESESSPMGTVSSLVRDLVFGPDETRAMGVASEKAYQTLRNSGRLTAKDSAIPIGFVRARLPRDEV